MKKIFYILTVLLVVSCSNNPEDKITGYWGLADINGEKMKASDEMCEAFVDNSHAICLVNKEENAIWSDPVVTPNEYKIVEENGKYFIVYVKIGVKKEISFIGNDTLLITSNSKGKTYVEKFFRLKGMRVYNEPNELWDDETDGEQVSNILYKIIPFSSWIKWIKR